MSLVYYAQTMALVIVSYFENKKKEILLTINFLFDTMFITNQYIKMKEMFVR